MENKKYKKSIWVRRVYQERKQKGEFHLLIKDMMLHDNFLFFKYFRMNPTQYEQLLQKIAPRITKSAEKREPIGPSERLSVTLRYVFTGDSQTTIASSFRISLTSIGGLCMKLQTLFGKFYSLNFCVVLHQSWNGKKFLRNLKVNGNSIAM